MKKRKSAFTCAVCGKPIAVGQAIVTRDDGTVAHAECGEDGE